MATVSDARKVSVAVDQVQFARNSNAAAGSQHTADLMFSALKEANSVP